MSSLVLAELQLNDVPLECWLWASLLLSIVAAAAFGAGVCYAHLSLRWSLKRAQQTLSALVEHVVRTLETAHEACGWLERYPGMALNEQQAERLDSRRTKLLEAVTRLMERRVNPEGTAPPAAVDRHGRKLKPFQIEWRREPVDESTSLPDREAFEANLLQLLAAGTESEVESGLLLVKIDRVDQLAGRHGMKGVDLFARKLGGLLCRSVRDEDLVCRFAIDTFGVLIPRIDHESGRRLSATIRSTVLQYHFRLEETGPEVLVTASFGYTRISPAENFDLVLNRAGNALARSQKLGRNQLHAHNGETLVHCAAG